MLAIMATQPALLLLGYGTGDGLQLSLGAQKALNGVSHAYTLNPPPAVTRLLKSLRVRSEDLSALFDSERPVADRYLDVAGLLLRRAGEEPPVAFITAGSPLFLNSLNRFLVLKAREMGLEVQVLPAVSPLDALIADIGLDVGTFGLQAFDARGLVAREPVLNPGVPAFVLQVGLLAAVEGLPAESGEAAEAYLPLVRHLARFYGPEHPATLITLAEGSAPAGRRTLPLARFPELVPHIGGSSHLFLDIARETAPLTRQEG